MAPRSRARRGGVYHHAFYAAKLLDAINALIVASTATLSLNASSTLPLTGCMHSDAINFEPTAVVDQHQ